MREERRVSGRDAVPVWQRVPAFIVSRGRQKAGKKRKQEKGTVSRQLPSICLHIVFSRDIAARPRDMVMQNTGNPPFFERNHEICSHSGGPR